MPEQDVEVSLAEPKHGEGRRFAVGLIGLLLSCLQSACSETKAEISVELLPHMKEGPNIFDKM
jgi:hypothetical protein